MVCTYRKRYSLFDVPGSTTTSMSLLMPANSHRYIAESVELTLVMFTTGFELKGSLFLRKVMGDGGVGVQSIRSVSPSRRIILRGTGGSSGRKRGGREGGREEGS